MTGDGRGHSVATMSRLIDFYKTQIDILWKWRGGPVALLKRLVITFLVAVVSLILTAAILPGVTIGRLADAAIAVILMTLFNALIRPVILTLVAPISLVLTGILVIVLQVVTFLVIVPLAPGVEVNGFLTALIASFVYAAFNTVLTSIFAIDSGGSYFGLLVSTMMTKRAAAPTDQPGLVIVQIDGLAHPILAGRVRAGSVNMIGSWIRDGSHKLSRWEAILPSMTSASQAGILHGNNDGIPAFRWYERDRQHLMVSSNPDDAAEIVRRVSNGEGLLSNDGVSICNLMTGDATRAYVTTARDQGPVAGHRRQQGVPGLLLQPERLPALVHDVHGRVHQRADPGAPDASIGHPAADAPRLEVRRHARRQQRAASRREHVADHRGDVPRRERHLRRLHRLRRARPPLRPGAGRVVPGARRRRRGDRRRSPRPPRTRRGRTSSSSCRTTARASARRSSSATARASARSSAT